MEKEPYKIATIVSISKGEGKVTFDLSSDAFDTDHRGGCFHVTLDENEESLKLQEGDLVKFEVAEPKELIKMSSDKMTFEEYGEIREQAKHMTSEKLIETYNSLIGKFDDYGELSSRFINYILNFDFGFIFPKEFGENFADFLASKEVSDYFKNWFYDKIKKNPLKGKNPIIIEGAVKALQSNKNIVDFSEEELNYIYRAIQGNYHQLENIVIFLTLKLESDGVRGFLNNCAYSSSLIERIVSTSGFSSKIESYSGRRGNTSDFSAKHLKAIYDKLKKLDEKKALNMLKMVINMKILGAAEFMKALYKLASNGYVYDKKLIARDNKDLGDIKGMAANSNILNALEESEFEYTEKTKVGFLSLLTEEEAAPYTRVRRDDCGVNQ